MLSFWNSLETSTEPPVFYQAPVHTHDHLHPPHHHHPHTINTTGFLRERELPESLQRAEERKFLTGSSDLLEYQLAEKQPHLHLLNVTETHTLVFANGNKTFNRTYFRPAVHGAGVSLGATSGFTGGGGGGFGGGFGGALSSWYQLNLGLIGIGALAVVAIIGSRNFFSNFVTQNTVPFGLERDDPYGGGNFQSEWYEDWYNRWYGNHNDKDDYYEDNNYYNPHDRHRYDSDYDYRRRYKRDLTEVSRGTKPKSSVADPGGTFGTETTESEVTDGESKLMQTEVRTKAAHCAFRITCELTRLQKRLLSDCELKLLRDIRYLATEKCRLGNHKMCCSFIILYNMNIEYAITILLVGIHVYLLAINIRFLFLVYSLIIFK